MLTHEGYLDCYLPPYLLCCSLKCSVSSNSSPLWLVNVDQIEALQLPCSTQVELHL